MPRGSSYIFQRKMLFLCAKTGIFMHGIVYKSTGSWYQVKAENGDFFSCRMKGKFRTKGIKSTNPIAVGDKVIFLPEDNNHSGQGIINEILTRKNYLIRRSVNLSKQTHIIAANIDYALLMITLNNPPTLTTFIDRFLVTTQAYDVPTVLLFNKIDAYSQEELEEVQYLKYVYQSIGYQCIEISAEQGTNLGQVVDLMHGHTCVISGHSGAGKSTLINKIAPELNLRTQELSAQFALGQHTTTFAQMFDLPFGGRIIDTPGIKGFGVVDIPREELANYFPEFFALKPECKFHNCIHLEEPGCAVKHALDQNQLAWSRYQSYLQMLGEEKQNYRTDFYAE